MIEACGHAVVLRGMAAGLPGLRKAGQRNRFCGRSPVEMTADPSVLGTDSTLLGRLVILKMLLLSPVLRLLPLLWLLPPLYHVAPLILPPIEPLRSNSSCRSRSIWRLIFKCERI